MKLSGISVELAIARDLAERYGWTIVRRKDGFVIMYKKICQENNNQCKRVLLWVRKSPINERTVDYIGRVLKRIAHDEVWLLKLYLEPDFTEEYKKLVNREFARDELEEYLSSLANQ